MPLEILGRDTHHVAVLRTRQVQVEITTEETGEKTVKTRDINAAYYLNPFHAERVCHGRGDTGILL
jgi:hypothetical protein